MLGHYILLMSPQGGGDQGSSFMSSIILFGLIFVVFYFMIIRPQQKRQKDRQKMLDAVKKGDKVITAGGIHGTVAGLDEKTVLVQIADNLKVKVERGSISSIVREAEPVEEKK